MRGRRATSAHGAGRAGRRAPCAPASAPTDRGSLALVVAHASLIVGLASSAGPDVRPAHRLVLPLLLGSLLLGPRQLPWFVVFVLRAR